MCKIMHHDYMVDCIKFEGMVPSPFQNVLSTRFKAYTLDFALVLHSWKSDLWLVNHL